MKREHSILRLPCAAPRSGLSKAAQRVGMAALGLLLGLTAISAPPHAAATPACAPSVVLSAAVAVYLYDASNTAVLTPSAVITEGSVYTDTGFAGTIDSADRIVNANVVVGYVTHPNPN